MCITRHYDINIDLMEKNITLHFEVAPFYSIIKNWNIHVKNTHKRRYPYKAPHNLLLTAQYDRVMRKEINGEKR